MASAVVWFCKACDRNQRNVQAFCRHCFASKPKVRADLTVLGDPLEHRPLFSMSDTTLLNRSNVSEAVHRAQQRSIRQGDGDFFDQLRPSHRSIARLTHRNAYARIDSLQLKACALCGVCFPKKQLPGSVSCRAVLNWKVLRGVEKPTAKNKCITRLYDVTQVCVFCLQLLDTSFGNFVDLDRLERSLMGSTHEDANEEEECAAGRRHKRIEDLFNRPMSRMGRQLTKDALLLRSTHISSSAGVSRTLRDKVSKAVTPVARRPLIRGRTSKPVKLAFITETRSARSRTIERTPVAPITPIIPMDPITPITLMAPPKGRGRRASSLNRLPPLVSPTKERVFPWRKSDTGESLIAARGVKTQRQVRPLLLVVRRGSEETRSEATATLGHSSLLGYVSAKLSSAHADVSASDAMKEPANLQMHMAEKSTEALVISDDETYALDFEEEEAESRAATAITSLTLASSALPPDSTGGRRQFVRGGTLSSQGRRPDCDSKTPKLRSRVGMGFEKNFLEVA